MKKLLTLNTHSLVEPEYGKKLELCVKQISEEIPDVIAMQELVGTVYCSREVRSYVAQIAAITRSHPALALGVSPRGAIALIRASQGCAVLAGRDYILPDDVQRMALPVLSHRLILTPEARMKGQSAQQILHGLLASIPVPVSLP